MSVPGQRPRIPEAAMTRRQESAFGTETVASTDVGLDAPPDIELAFAASRAEAALFSVATPVCMGRYVLLDRLGSGGMGIVYAAYDPTVDRKIAIKLLHRSATDVREAPARLVREARALGRLNHPNVVTVYDVGTVGGDGAQQVFIAMEMVAGTTLTRWCAQPRAASEVLEVMLQAANGLAAAHAVGLVHRDFKPDNVMVGDDGRVRVMDFGLARPLARDSNDHTLSSPNSAIGPSLSTRDGSLVGTPAYMAPEQLAGDPADARSDQFAFCLTLWEALSGTTPQRRRRDDSLATALQNLEAAAPLARGLAGSLAPVLRRGLAPRPDDRFSTMHGLVDALRSRPRRRRWLIRSTVAVSIAVAMGCTSYLRALDRDRGCSALADEIDVQWNDDRRAQLEAAFAASEVPFARATSTRVLPTIDQHAALWSAIRRDVCLQRGTAAAVPEQFRSQSEACLVEARERFAALLTRLERADVSAVQRASSSVSGLPDPTRCTDAGELASRSWSLPPSAMAEPIAALRSTLAEATAAIALGDPRAAATLSEHVVETADELGWPPLVFEARWTAAEVAMAGGDSQTGVARYEEALHAASVASDQYGMAVTLIAMISAIGGKLGEHERAAGVGIAAAALVAQLEPQPGLLSARLANGLGSVAIARARYDEAVQQLLRARDIAEGVLGAEDPLHASLATNLGTAYFRQANYPAARASFERAVELSGQFLGSDHPDVGRALGNLATVYLATGDDELGRRTLERALANQERALGADHPAVANSLTNLAHFHEQHDAADVARPIMARALAIRERALGSEHRDTLQSSLGLAKVELELGETDAALVRAQRVLALRERSFGADHRELLLPLGVISHARYERGEYSEAIALSERALRIVERDGAESSQAITILEDIAITRDAMGELARAQELHAKVYSMIRRDETTGRNVAISEIALGSLARRTGDLPAAARWLQRARQSLELGEHDVGTWELELEHGKLAAATRRWADALAHYDHALAAAVRERGTEDTRYATIELAQGEALLATGRRAEARRLAEHASAVLDRGVGARARARSCTRVPRSAWWVMPPRSAPASVRRLRAVARAQNPDADAHDAVAGFADHHIAGVAIQQLDRDLAIEFWIVRRIHDAHRPRADPLEQDVASQLDRARGIEQRRLGAAGSESELEVGERQHRGGLAHGRMSLAAREDSASPLVATVSGQQQSEKQARASAPHSARHAALPWHELWHACNSCPQKLLHAVDRQP